MIIINKAIWNKETGNINSYACFKTEFIIEELQSKTILNISADSEYAVYVNEKFVDCGQFDDYPFDKIYDEIDVSSFLKQGNNELKIEVYHQGVSTFQYVVGKAGLWFEIISNGNIVSKSSSKVLSAPIIGFKQGELPMITEQLGYTYHFDAGKQYGTFAESTEFDFVNVRKRPIKKCFLTEKKARLKTQGVFIRDDGDYLAYKEYNSIFDNGLITEDNVYLLYDFEVERTGYFCFEIDAEEGTQIDIYFGEHLDDLRVRGYVGNRVFKNTYICKKGIQKFFYPFKRIACRYVELHAYGKLNKVVDLSILHCEYPLKDITVSDGDDYFTKKLNDISKYTLKMCMHEHYEDCPWREQALYGADSRNQMLFGYYSFGEFEFARANLILLGQGLGLDGNIRICSPSDSELRIPSFTFIWIHAIKEYIEFSGDSSFAEEMCEKIKYVIDSVVNEITDVGIKSKKLSNVWNFYEWSYGLDNESSKYCFDNVESDGLFNVYAILAIKSAVEILKNVNDECLERYEAILTKLVEIVNDVFWDESVGAYATYISNGEKTHYCELMQVMALYTGVAKEKEKHLSELIKNDNELVKISLCNFVYKYDALMNTDKNNLSYIIDDMYKIWGKMAFSGTSTFWETRKGADDFDNAGSLCHGWSALPIYINQKYVHGVTKEDIYKKSQNSDN